MVHWGEIDATHDSMDSSRQRPILPASRRACVIKVARTHFRYLSHANNDYFIIISLSVVLYITSQLLESQNASLFG